MIEQIPTTELIQLNDIEQQTTEHQQYNNQLMQLNYTEQQQYNIIVEDLDDEIKNGMKAEEESQLSLSLSLYIYI